MRGCIFKLIHLINGVCLSFDLACCRTGLPAAREHRPKTGEGTLQLDSVWCDCHLQLQCRILLDGMQCLDMWGWGQMDQPSAHLQG